MQAVDHDTATRTPAGTADAAGFSPRLGMAAVALAVAAVAAPSAVALIAATGSVLWRPVALSGLIGLLVLAPAGVALATALIGLHRIGAPAQTAGSQAEQSVLRVLVAAALFGYALAVSALKPIGGPPPVFAEIGALALVAAWVLLLCVILWPAKTAIQGYGATLFDMAVISALLHFGQGWAAGCYPLYLAAVLYCGSRYGLRALAASSLAGALGFAAVILTTDFWRGQPALAAGLALALGLIPAILAGTVRATAAAREAASRAEMLRQRTLLAIAEGLQDGSGGGNRGPAGPVIGEILDYAAIEAGAFAQAVETFDVRALVRNALAPLQATGADAGTALFWRVDPRVPYRLRGRAVVVSRIVATVADHALRTTHGRTVRICLDCGITAGRGFALQVRAAGLPPREDAPEPVHPLGLQLLDKLVAMAGGTVQTAAPGGRAGLEIALPLEIEAGAAMPLLDLAGRMVLIVTTDGRLARDMEDALTGWNAELRHVGEGEAGLTELAERSDGRRAVVVIDGRGKLLSALGVAHRAAGLGTNAPFTLLLANEEQIANLAAVEEGELDALLPAPFSAPLLAKALYGLPLISEHRTAPVSTDRERFATAGAPQELPDVTPISAHPKFAADDAVVDPRAMEALRALDGGSGFLAEVTAGFRLDAEQIMERVAAAAQSADTKAFAQGIAALRRAARHLGGGPLSELTATLQHATASELHRYGVLYVQRLRAEIGRLSDAVAVALDTAGTHRG